LATTRHKQRAAFVKEATAFAQESDWQANGTKVHLAAPADTSGVAQSLLKDERTTTRVAEMAGPSVKGLRNTTASASVYITGKDEVTSDTTQVAETSLMVLLEHCMGGVDRSNATTAAVGGSHSTTAVELTSSTNYAAGQMLGVIDAGDTDSIVEWARITDITADVATLDRALSFTPTDGDKVIGTATAYYDPDVLEDSNAANRQLSWWFEQGESATGFVELIGTKAGMSLEGFERDGLPRITLNINATYWTNSADGTTHPTWSGATTGQAPVAFGPRTKFFFQDYGTTTDTTTIHLSELSVDPALAPVPISAVTSQTDNAQGSAGWSQGPYNPTASFTITPHSDAYDTDLGADTFKVFGVFRRNVEGSSFCVWFPRAEISATPVLGANGEVLATQVTILGHEDLDAVGTTDIVKSPMVIGLG